MAQPWKHPATGKYYIRRAIPELLRPAFGGKREWKVSLDTRDFARAAILFAGANADLEQKFEEARARLETTGDPRPSQRDRAAELVHAYFEGPPNNEGALDGIERLQLARLEIDRGLWNSTLHGCTPPQPLSAERWWQLSENAALYRGDTEVRRPLNKRAIGEIWRFADSEFVRGTRADQVARVVVQVGRYHGLPTHEMPDGIDEVITDYLNRLPIGTTTTRKPRSAQSRLRPLVRLLELFEEWRAGAKPKPQTAHEFLQSTQDFIDYVGDIPVADIVNEDLLNYRDEAQKLPRSMPRVDRELPFAARVAKHAASDGPRISPATLKKRVGAIQALLSYAQEQRWITKNEGKGVPIANYSKANRSRRPLEEHEIQQLLSGRLFVDINSWNFDRSVSDQTLYWLLLLGLTTGARLEEIGQAALDDVKSASTVTYIDIDNYAHQPEGGTSDAGEVSIKKSVKNESSRRVVPVHGNLISLGFHKYCDELKNAGSTQLFPDLRANQFDKRTKEASRIVNRYIDRYVSNDGRITFHSLRHGFKDLALEAGISERIIDQICGHTPTTVGGSYGRGVRLPVLNTSLHRVDWSFLDWATLQKASASIDWQQTVQRMLGPKKLEHLSVAEAEF